MSSIASVAAQQAAANAAAASSSATTSTATHDFSALSGNENTFLNLLMTQLQHQDPTSPLDTSQFTSQLVQYSGVEQQIKTNSSLNSLIQLTQGTETVQASSLLAKQVQVASSQLSVRGGAAQEVEFSTTGTQPISIVVTDAHGNQLASENGTSQNGVNKWTWAPGSNVPDGLYEVVVSQNNPDGSATALSTSVVGKATGVVNNGSSVTLSLDNLQVDFSKLQSVDPS